MVSRICCEGRSEAGFMSHWPAESLVSITAVQNWFLLLSSRFRVWPCFKREEFLSITFQLSFSSAMKRPSIFAPVFFWAKNLAGRTFVLFMTRQSPLLMKRAICEKRLSSRESAERSRTSIRLSERLGAGFCAISSGGKW